MDMNKELILTEEQLRQAIETWKPRLKLQDWVIEVELVPQRLIEGYDGKVRTEMLGRRAMISIPTPDTYYPNATGRVQNMLLTLAHEMIHLVFPHVHKQSELFPSVTDYDMWEQGIETIAELLINSKPIGEEDDRINT